MTKQNNLSRNQSPGSSTQERRLNYLLGKPAGPTCFAGSVIEPIILTIVSFGITCFIVFTVLEELWSHVKSVAGYNIVKFALQIISRVHWFTFPKFKNITDTDVSRRFCNIWNFNNLIVQYRIHSGKRVTWIWSRKRLEEHELLIVQNANFPKNKISGIVFVNRHFKVSGLRRVFKSWYWWYSELPRTPFQTIKKTLASWTSHSLSEWIIHTEIRNSRS